MQQNYHIQGRKSPKQIVGLEQKINQYFSNKIEEKQIIADIISRPQLEEIIPFSEILNQKRMKYSNVQNQLHNKQLNKTYKVEKKQIKNHTSRSSNSNLHNRDKKSQKSNKKFESCCSCYCWGCSRKNSTRITKPRTPQMKGEHYYVNQTNKTSESNQAIKQYSIANSQSKCVQIHTKPHSTEQRKQNIINNCCKINHLGNPKPSQAISQYSESAKQYSQKEYLQIQKQMQNVCSLKKCQPSTREQKPKVAWRVDIQKIEEGKIRKMRVEKLTQMYKELANKYIMKYRSSSHQNKIQFQQEQNKTNQKNIEQEKQITKIEQTEKDMKKYKQALDLFKKKKMQINIIKNNYNNVQNYPVDIKMENKIQCQKKKCESKPMEYTFQNYQSYQLVDIK